MSWVCICWMWCILDNHATGWRIVLTGITSVAVGTRLNVKGINHYIDVIMTTMASQITSLTVVYSIVYSGADQRKHQSSASLAFERGIHRRPVNSLHKWPVMRKMLPFDDVIMWPALFGPDAFYWYSDANSSWVRSLGSTWWWIICWGNGLPLNRW